MSEITHYTLLAPAGAREEADNLIKNLLVLDSLPPLSTSINTDGGADTILQNIDVVYLLSARSFDGNIFGEKG